MSLKRPHAISFSKKNAIRPFEDTSSLEFWAQKNDASLFLVGQSTKKRPDGMTLVRMYDNRVLDMCEVGVEEFKSMQEFKVSLFIFVVAIKLFPQLIVLCNRAPKRHPGTSRCFTSRPTCSTPTLGSNNSSLYSWTSSTERS